MRPDGARFRQQEQRGQAAHGRHRGRDPHGGVVAQAVGEQAAGKRPQRQAQEETNLVQAHPAPAILVRRYVQDDGRPTDPDARPGQPPQQPHRQQGPEAARGGVQDCGQHADEERGHEQPPPRPAVIGQPHRAVEQQPYGPIGAKEDAHHAQGDARFSRVRRQDDIQGRVAYLGDGRAQSQGEQDFGRMDRVSTNRHVAPPGREA